MARLLPWLLGAAAFGGGIVLLTREVRARTMTPTGAGPILLTTTAAPPTATHEPTEAEDIADWRKKMGLPPEGSAAAAAPAKQRIVLCFGDSITANNGGYYKNIKLPGNGVITNGSKGWGGQQVRIIAQNAEKVLKKIKATDVVLLAGVNDIASKRTVKEITGDLEKAWAQFHAAGARVIAVKLTPWFGYSTYFAPGKSTAQPFRDATNAVNAYIQDHLGQPGGPDVVVDTSSMGDEQGRLKKEFSAGNLHLSAAGSRELARLVAQAL